MSGQTFDQIWNNPGTGSWFTPGNWTNGNDNNSGVPTATQSALVSNGGTAQIGANNAVASSLTIGLPMPGASPAQVGSGTVEIQNGGFLTIGKQTSGGLTIGIGSNLIVDAGGGFFSYGPIENDGNITLNQGTFTGTFGGTGSITKLGGGPVDFLAVLNELAGVAVLHGTFIDASTSIGKVVVTGPNSILRVNSGITLGITPTVNSGGTVDNFGNITAGVVSRNRSRECNK